MTPPVVNEPDVLHVIPSVRLLAKPLFEERNRQIGTARPARIRLGEKNCAKPVRDVESRVERGRQIEQRIQQIVSAAAVLNIRRRWADDGTVGTEHALGATVILNRANPVQVRCQRPVRDAEPTRRRPRLQIQPFGVWRRKRI